MMLKEYDTEDCGNTEGWKWYFRGTCFKPNSTPSCQTRNEGDCPSETKCSRPEECVSGWCREGVCRATGLEGRNHVFNAGGWCDGDGDDARCATGWCKDWTCTDKPKDCEGDWESWNKKGNEWAFRQGSWYKDGKYRSRSYIVEKDEAHGGSCPLRGQTEEQHDPNHHVKTCEYADKSSQCSDPELYRCDEDHHCATDAKCEKTAGQDNVCRSTKATGRAKGTYCEADDGQCEGNLICKDFTCDDALGDMATCDGRDETCTSGACARLSGGDDVACCPRDADGKGHKALFGPDYHCTHLRAGDACFHDGQCGSDGYCNHTEEGDHGGVCRTRVRKVDETCNGSQDACVSNAECRDGVCRRVHFRVEEESCEVPQDCVRGLVCLAGATRTCAKPRTVCTDPEGCDDASRCTDTGDCEAGAVCNPDEGLCRAYAAGDLGSAAFGEWCADSSNCGITTAGTPLECIEQRCIETCHASQYYSENFRCLDQRGYGETCTGAANECKNDGVCVDGVCQPDCAPQETLDGIACVRGTTVHTVTTTFVPNEGETLGACRSYFSPRVEERAKEACLGKAGDLCENAEDCDGGLLCYRGRCEVGNGCLHGEEEVCPHLQNLSNPPLVADHQATEWHRMGAGLFQVLRKLSDDESAALTHSLKTHPEDVVFLDTGHLRMRDAKGTTKTVRNPAEATPPAFRGADDLVTLAKASKQQFLYDDAHLITRNLYYILHRDETGWYLLHNPLHRKDFADYYERVLTTDADPAMVAWGATTTATAGHVNLQRLFRNYAASMRVTKADGTEGYLDPTINLFLSQTNCRESAFYDTNATSHPVDDTYEAVLTQLGSGLPPACLCMGGPYNYASSQVPSTSFVHRFLRGPGVPSALPSIVNTVCELEISARGNLTIENSNLANECGREVATEKGRSEERGERDESGPTREEEEVFPTRDDGPSYSLETNQEEADSAPPSAYSTTMVITGLAMAVAGAYLLSQWTSTSQRRGRRGVSEGMQYY